MSNWFQFVEQWCIEHIVFSSAIIAFITSLLRLLATQPKKKFSTKILDSLLCSLFTMGIYYTIQSLTEINPNICVGIGCFVGYLGTEQVKELIFKRFELNTNKDTDNEDIG